LIDVFRFISWRRELVGTVRRTDAAHGLPQRAAEYRAEVRLEPLSVSVAAMRRMFSSGHPDTQSLVRTGARRGLLTAADSQASQAWKYRTAQSFSGCFLG
jgi:hypothetical protein